MSCGLYIVYKFTCYSAYIEHILIGVSSCKQQFLFELVKCRTKTTVTRIVRIKTYSLYFRTDFSIKERIQWVIFVHKIDNIWFMFWLSDTCIVCYTVGDGL